jgi:hypothetical protein
MCSRAQSSGHLTYVALECCTRFTRYPTQIHLPNTITAIAPSKLKYLRKSVALNYYLDARELPITIVFTALPPRLPPVTLDACQSAACRSGTLS